jgi:hypothetical protein
VSSSRKRPIRWRERDWPPITTVCLVCHDTRLGAFTHQLDRILPVAVPQSGLAPPYTHRRLGSGRLMMCVYVNLNGLELPDRAQRRCEDHRICRWRGPPSRSSQPVALGSSVPWSFPALVVARLTGSFAKWNYQGHGNLPSGHRSTISAAAIAKTNTTAHADKWPALIASPSRSRARVGRRVVYTISKWGNCDASAADSGLLSR